VFAAGTADFLLKPGRPGETLEAVEPVLHPTPS